ncbi:MAG: flavodoxin [Oscillospiraceae bacterium]|nr:flavodoxin [Oscillospiraceae bacterium]
MKTLVVYYSLEGNTKYAAELIAEKTGADLLRIEPEKAYPDGKLSKFIWGGKSAVMAETPALMPYDTDISSYGCIILGFPVWASNVAPPVRTFVRDNDIKGRKIGFFACQAGTGAEKAFGKLRAAIGIEKEDASLVLIDPKSKKDPENEKRISEFCDKLL